MAIEQAEEAQVTRMDWYGSEESSGKEVCAVWKEGTCEGCGCKKGSK